MCGSLEPDDLFVVLSLEFARDCDGEVSKLKSYTPNSAPCLSMWCIQMISPLFLQMRNQNDTIQQSV